MDADADADADPALVPDPEATQDVELDLVVIGSVLVMMCLKETGSPVLSLT